MRKSYRIYIYIIIIINDQYNHFNYLISKSLEPVNHLLHYYALSSRKREREREKIMNILLL